MISDRARNDDLRTEPDAARIQTLTLVIPIGVTDAYLFATSVVTSGGLPHDSVSFGYDNSTRPDAPAFSARSDSDGR